MKRTVAGEIEIVTPKRIWAARFSEAEHLRERAQEACVDRWSQRGGEGRNRKKDGHEGHKCTQRRKGRE